VILLISRPTDPLVAALSALVARLRGARC